MPAMSNETKRYGLLWTDPDGTPQASAAGYDKRAAKFRRAELEAVGCTSIEIVQVRYGELPEPAV
ncbi:hypothetical protein G6W55_16445 [Streptomyces sp. CAI-85]|uniref:Uncharacterized protein n=2 Tax=Streptomyces TaxID=1883 RepID=A0AAE6Y3S0_STRAT|nr:hypothetical protein [Streptomyces sp. S9]NUV61268.1 hypothetical protein [Streptomyces sp. CAI-85]OOQ54716.1 hypothetical protein AFM16_01305 [Streptomyces antibioticus]QIT42357.1 hypothetical protein HCX60_01470 [Streptomyces antibioticus]